MQLLLLSCILSVMVTASTQTARNPVEQLVTNARVARALEWLEKNLAWIGQEHVRITEIPAPPFKEAERAAYLRRMLEASGLKVHLDEAGNVVGERPGASSKDVVLVSAHLDTVFPAGTDVRVRTGADGRLRAPGISDNSNGLAALLAVARALSEAKIRTRATLVFAANVGEEGEGNLRGMRQLTDTYKDRLRFAIAIDGTSTEHVTVMALGSRRLEVVVTGPGGHSWSDFGLPNPVHALARGIARFVKVHIPDEPRSSFNVGVIEGGTSVNSIPYRASIKVDMRSESPQELERLEAALREAIQAGVDEEMAAARNAGTSRRGASAQLETKFRSLGVRPGGELAADSPLLQAIRDVDRYLGNRARLERASTDANIPLSMRIPAIALGGGGQGGGAHSLNEWYDPTGRELGLKRILLTLLSVAGPER